MSGDPHALTALLTTSAPAVSRPGYGRDVARLLPDQILLAGAVPLRLVREPLPEGREASRVTELVARLRPDVVLHIATSPTHGLRLVATAGAQGHGRLTATWPAPPLAGRLRGHGIEAEVCDDPDEHSAAVLRACLSACRDEGLEDTLTGLLHLPGARAEEAPVDRESLGYLLVELADQVRRRRAWREGRGRLCVPRPVRTLRVGLTGGIGSGKSTVAGLLAHLGAHVVDADTLAHEALAPGSVGLARVRGRFGEDVLDADGTVDRAALAARVFADPQARADLEALTLPWIAQAAAERIEVAGPGEVGVYDVPLLAEGGMADLFDLVVVVETPMEQRLARLERRGLPRAQALARMRAQATDEQRRALADVVLVNNGTTEDLADGVTWIWEQRVLPALA